MNKCSSKGRRDMHTCMLIFLLIHVELFNRFESANKKVCRLFVRLHYCAEIKKNYKDYNNGIENNGISENKSKEFFF